MNSLRPVHPGWSRFQTDPRCPAQARLCAITCIATRRRWRRAAGRKMYLHSSRALSILVPDGGRPPCLAGFHRSPGPDEAVKAVGGEEGQLGTGRGLDPPDDEPHRPAAWRSVRDRGCRWSPSPYAAAVPSSMGSGTIRSVALGYGSRSGPIRTPLLRL